MFTCLRAYHLPLSYDLTRNVVRRVLFVVVVIIVVVARVVVNCQLLAALLAKLLNASSESFRPASISLPALLTTRRTGDPVTKLL